MRRDPGGSEAGNQRRGSTGVIVGGPGRDDGWIWWNVDFDAGVDGWLRESSISEDDG
ncbi:MAG: hypothetical protein ACFB00_14130 [Parvularculaceae bacterium]